MLTNRQNDRIRGLVTSLCTASGDEARAKATGQPGTKLMQIQGRYRELWNELSEMLDEMTITARN